MIRENYKIIDGVVFTLPFFVDVLSGDDDAVDDVIGWHNVGTIAFVAVEAAHHAERRPH